jgi:hypothetical protein
VTRLLGHFLRFPHAPTESRTPPAIKAGRAFPENALEHFQEKWTPVFRPKMFPVIVKPL